MEGFHKAKNINSRFIFHFEYVIEVRISGVLDVLSKYICSRRLMGSTDQADPS